MHESRSIDLHGHAIGTTSIEPMQIQHLFEVKKQALHFPTPRVQTQGIADRQALGLYDVGQHFPTLASFAPPDPAQSLGGNILFAFDLNQCVPSRPSGNISLGQLTQPSPALTPVTPTEPDKAPLTQGCKEGPHAVQPIPYKQGAFGDLLQGSDRPWQFARCRIGMEGQMADYPTVQIIKGRQTARQYLRSDVPKQLEPLGYRGQARAVDDPDLFKILPQGMDRRRITGLSLRQHLNQKGLIQVGKEMPVQVLAALEKRFWARLHRGPPRAVAECGFLQGLGQGLRSTQNDFGPKRY